MTDATPSAFSQGGTVKRKSRPRSAKAAAIYAHVIADELLAVWQETLRAQAYDRLQIDHPAIRIALIDDALFHIVDTFRDLRREVES